MAKSCERLPDRGGDYYSHDEVAGLIGITVGRLRNKSNCGVQGNGVRRFSPYYLP